MTCREDQPTGAFQWATFHADRNDLKAALPWFEKALKWDTRLTPARHRYATALQQLGRADDAVDVLLTGSDLEPTNGLYPYWLGLLYHEQGKTQLARDALRAAVTRDDSQPRFWYNLALADLQLGNTDAALDGIARAEELAPRDPQYPYTRATIHLQLRQPDRAREALERTLELAPNHPQAMQMLRGL
jgi:tetratricopeptide (TPR) repeat protein